MIQIAFADYKWGVENTELGALIHAQDVDSGIAVAIPVTGDTLSMLIGDLIAARNARDAQNA